LVARELSVLPVGGTDAFREALRPIVRPDYLGVADVVEKQFDHVSVDLSHIAS
jgi:2-phosphoglycerate kinase